MTARPVALLLLAMLAGCARPVGPARGVIIDAYRHADPATRAALARDHGTGAPALLAILAAAPPPRAFPAALRARFDLEPLPGRDGTGEVHLTAYFTPEHDARLEPDARFRHALYRRPADVARGTAWHPRRAIMAGDLLAGHEIAWLDDALSAYLIEVNGSARLRLGDGRVLHLGHEGTNERAYTSLGRELVAAGLASADGMSMQRIRALHQADPARVEALMRRNDRFVFFRVLDEPGPRSTLGDPLFAHATIATDHAEVPAGAILLVAAPLPGPDGVVVPSARFMVNTDTGGAITGPARADLYFGTGPEAGARAGRVNTIGRLYRLVPRAGPTPAIP